jgi:hypothetical protein
MQQGQSEPEPYIDAFDDFERRIRFVAIGPRYDRSDGDGSCLSGATTWGVERFQDMADATGGMYRPITEAKDVETDSCPLSNFAEHLEKLGDLLNSLETAFQLQSVPDVSTIQVYVDDEPVIEAPIYNEDEYSDDPDNVVPSYGDGWSYSSGDNAVVFWGEAIPDYNSDVRIFYRPLSGTPRDLPFLY